VYRTRCSIPYK